MNEGAPSISVIVCAYTEQRWHELDAALQSLGKQTLLAHEIILVIDHNAPLFERARASFSKVIVIENQEPRGLSGARNSGLAIATGSIIAFIDDDAIAAPDWLVRLAAPYGDPRVLGVGGSIQPQWHSARPRWFPPEFDWVVGCTYLGMPTQPTPVRNLIGCNMSFRRQVFETLGGFRIGRIGALSIGQENDETEFCIRLKQNWSDSQILYDPQAQVLHQVSPNRTTWKYYCSRCYSEGLSKATLSKSVGSKDGLASERTYTFQYLPRGGLKGLRDAARGDLFGLGRSFAIGLGLFCTVMGFGLGTLSFRWNALRRSPSITSATLTHNHADSSVS